MVVRVLNEKSWGTQHGKRKRLSNLEHIQARVAHEATVTRKGWVKLLLEYRQVVLAHGNLQPKVVIIGFSEFDQDI